MGGPAGGSTGPDPSPRRLALGLLALAGLITAAPSIAGARPAPPPVRIRVNQVGYAPAAPKRALALLGRAVARVPFTVRAARGGRVVMRGVSGRSLGGQNRRWPAVEPLDLSRLRRPGAYYVRIGRTRSPVFRVRRAALLYAPLVAGSVGFLQAQRDGSQVIPGPLGRRPAHLSDASATVYATPRYRGMRLIAPLRPTAVIRDVLGGWFDAGDYLKFTETTSFTDSLLLFAIREYPAAMPADALAEARFGTDWLLRMWDPARGVLYSQVGIGDGNGRTVLGDHDLWRLPQVDDRLPAGPRSPVRYIARRPVFAANAPGRRISPNLAGRTAAAFALCAQDFAGPDPAYARRCLLAGEQVYALADTSPRGRLATTAPFAYYPETLWRDDMELGATELYLAVRRLGGGAAGGRPVRLPDGGRALGRPVHVEPGQRR